jgi:hypothetical protein
MQQSNRSFSNVPRRLAFLAAAALALAIGTSPALPAAAQSAAMPLQAGENAGSSDSLIGPQTYFFQATPGHFTVQILQVAGTSTDSVALNGNISVQAGFGTPGHGNLLSLQQIHGGLLIHGTAARPGRVNITIVPVASPLVRVVRNYVVTASGSVAFAGPGADPIIGTYISLRNNYGATKFNKNGTIVTSSGQPGMWTVFDPALRIYNVQIGDDRISLKLVSGRGLVDAGSSVIVFQFAH